MKTLCSRLNRDLHVPVMVDSTRPEVVEAALARLAGRSVVNSAHLEDPDRARRIIELCRRHGAALVLLTIDEQGMAMTLKRKLAVADRLYRLAVEEGGLEPSSLFFDFLTFTLGSGEESLRDAARQTLDAVEAARARFPESLTILGVSNVSHGLAPEVRRALNSVFLARAVERGLDAAIMHAGRVLPLSELDPQVVVFCNDLISNRHGKGSLSLQRLLAACCRQDHPAAGATAGRPARAARSARARLWQAILAGNTSDGRTALEELLGRTPALQLIQEHLVPAMDEVGRLFGQGRMQLPFVLRAAETVRALLSVAAARMPPRARRSRGKLVIATVRGDVHDIGKNLVDLVVSSAGFEVVNLGVRQTAEDIITAVERHRPNAIGLSGLLVESARVMREYLETFERRGIRIPVICGGAALTNVFVAKDLKPVYTGEVCYAKDAIAGLGIMKRITSVPSVFQVSRTLGASSIFRGTKIERAGGDRLWQYVDLEAVVVKRWKLLPPGAPASQMAKAKQMADSAIRQYNKRGIWHGGYVYGIFLGRATPKALLLLHPGSEEEMSQFNLAPAELRKLARRFKNEAFHVGLQVVTIGPYVTPEAQRLVADGKVADSFFLHGVAAEMVEGLAEFCQAQMPPFPDWKKADRFSPGFPAWPALREQRKVFDVLRAERIGVQLTETWQIVPEYSASAIVLPAV
jgi:5-methyltetrahydrofolate--homocysteine methyltransferase